LGRSWFEASLGKNLVRLHLNQELGGVGHSYHPSEGRKLKIEGLQSTLAQAKRENNQSKKC
jgi:hypothetical protein